MDNTNPTLNQVGGSHYLKLRIHPDQFAMANGMDADAFSALKYLTRFRDKNGAEDLRKAKHFIQRRRAFLAVASHRYPGSCDWLISIDSYIRENQVKMPEAHAMRLLADLCQNNAMTTEAVLIETIEMMEIHYLANQLDQYAATIS